MKKREKNIEERKTLLRKIIVHNMNEEDLVRGQMKLPPTRIKRVTPRH